jgi:transposase
VPSGWGGTLGGMLSTVSGQVGFFDAAGLVGPLPEGSIFALLQEHGERIVCDEDFADCYSDGVGRPSIRPSLLAKVLLLQCRTGLSDEQAMETLRWDLRWKAALDLPIDHAGHHPTSLTKFRARLLLHGKERLALEATLRLAGELGLLDAPAEQIVDSTPMLGAAATQDTVTLVRSGVRRLIDAVGSADREAARLLEDGLEFDYERPREKPDCRWREKAERERMLTRVAQDAERALRAVAQADELLQDERVKEAHGLLRELVGQDFDVDCDGVPRLHRGTRAGRILSVHDTEMRHGRKSQHQRFDGYKLSAAATNGESPLITAVALAPASEHDGPQAKRLVDSQPDTLKPRRIVGDTAYGSADVREQLEDRSVDVLAPAATARNPHGFHKDEFRIDLEAETVTCPAGHTQRLSEPDRNGERAAHFRRSQCGACPLKPRCTTQPHRSIRLRRREDLLLAARLALEEPQTAEHLRRTRPRIERLLSLLAHRYGARKSRYRGASKSLLQASFAAALVNLNPIGAALRAEAA